MTWRAISADVGYLDGIWFCPADSDLNVRMIFYWHALHGIEGYDHPAYYQLKDGQSLRVHLPQIWPTLDLKRP